MGAGDGSRQIERGTAASAAFAAGVRRAMAITAAMNRLTYEDLDEVRALFAEVTIGDDVLVGPNVSLITSGHPVEPSQRTARLVGEPIHVEANVWIAAGAIVLGGVTIGENSVVAAGSVVTRDVPPNTLVGGNPATVLRSIAGL